MQSLGRDVLFLSFRTFSELQQQQKYQNFLVYTHIRTRANSPRAVCKTAERNNSSGGGGVGLKGHDVNGESSRFVSGAEARATRRLESQLFPVPHSPTHSEEQQQQEEEE